MTKRAVANKTVNLGRNITSLAGNAAVPVHLAHLLSAQNYRQYSHSAIYRADIQFPRNEEEPLMDGAWKVWTIADNWRTRAAFKFARKNWEQSVQDELDMLGKDAKPRWLEFISALPIEFVPGTGQTPAGTWNGVTATGQLMTSLLTDANGNEGAVDGGHYEPSIVTANVDTETGEGDDVQFIWDTQASDPTRFFSNGGFLSIMYEYDNRTGSIIQDDPAVTSAIAPYDVLHPTDVIEEDYLEIQQSNTPPYQGDALLPVFQEHMVEIRDGDLFASTGMIDIPYGLMVLQNMNQPNPLGPGLLGHAVFASGDYHGVKAELV